MFRKKLAMPTRSVSVELFVLIFFFVELMIGNPRSKDNPPHECPRILGWTANNASIHHFKISLLLALRVSESLSVLLFYHIRCTKLSQSPLSGTCTLVFRNAMDMQVSGLALLVVLKFFATRTWNSTTFFWYSSLHCWERRLNSCPSHLDITCQRWQGYPQCSWASWSSLDHKMCNIG